MILQPTTTVRSTGGMVCAVDHLAAHAGVAMLQSGGSAVDAAVASSAVLAVTTQNRCGMGGDLLALVSVPGDEPIAMNSSGFAGAGADPEQLRRDGHRVMPFRDHIATVTVPGCVDGWLALHERFGKLDLSEVLAPALHYAADGFPASPDLVRDLPAVAHMPEASDYTTGGPIEPGSIIRRPGVARALSAIVTDGRSGFYEGEFGAELLALAPDQFSTSDLNQPIAKWTPALRASAFGHVIWTVPPNSQGYLTLASAAIASGLALPEDSADPLWAHLLIESGRQASFDRIDVLYDGADGGALVDEARLSPRRAAINPGHVAKLGDSYRAGGTIATTAVDGNGMGVSLVQSNAAGFGSHLATPGLKIFLHNRGMGFSLEKGHPAEYMAGRRPPHTLCPTIVTQTNGALAGVLGTSGGDSQPLVLLQILARWLHGGEEPGDILAAGRWTLADPIDSNAFKTWQHKGAVRVILEGNAPPIWDENLVARGHLVKRGPSYNAMFGQAHLIAVERDHLAGASDPRPRFGAALGY